MKCDAQIQTRRVHEDDGARPVLPYPTDDLRDQRAIEGKPLQHREADRRATGEVVQRTGLPQGHVSKSVARFRDRGAVTTTPDPADRRRTLVTPTASARDTVALQGAAMIDSALIEVPQETDVLVVSVTSPEDLLTALIAVRLLRKTRPRMHACLADHGYENFSLSPHL